MKLNKLYVVKDIAGETVIVPTEMQSRILTD